MQAYVHLVFAGLILAAYVTLTALGHDGNPVLSILVGQGLGAGISKLPTGGKP